MKIIIKRKVLSEALSEVTPFVMQKGPTPILKYAKIVTKGNRVKFESNNTQASVRRYVEAIEIDQDGSFLIDCADVSAYIGKCNGEDITLETKDDTLTVTHSKGHAQFQIMRVDEYPDFDMPTENITEFILPSSLLSEYINIGKNFVGTDDFRPQLKAIYAYVKDGKIGYCATDTHKMVADYCPIDNADGIDIHWFIEPSVFSAITKSCASVENITVKVSPTHVSYKIGNTVIQTLQTQGRFPDFNRVIPKEWAMECVVDKGEFVDTLKRTAYICDDSRVVKLDISPMDMTISSDDWSKGKKSSETIQHHGCNSEIKLGAHIDYLTTCISTCSNDEVVLRLSEPSKPILIYNADRQNANVLVMPMSI